MGRERLIRRHIDERLHLAELACHAGIRLRTAYKWLVRFRSGGPAALVDRRSIRRIETAKAQICSKVEHPFRVIKQRFGFQKTRLRGQAETWASVFWWVLEQRAYPALRAVTVPKKSKS